MKSLSRDNHRTLFKNATTILQCRLGPAHAIKDIMKTTLIAAPFVLAAKLYRDNNFFVIDFFNLSEFTAADH